MGGGVHGEVEGAVTTRGRELQVGHGGEAGDQLQAGGQQGAVEHGVAAAQHRLVDIDVVIVDCGGIRFLDLVSF